MLVAPVVLKHTLGIEAVTFQTVQSTIKRMYPIVVGMVDHMCEEAKCEVRHMDQSELGVVLSLPLMVHGWHMVITAGMLLSASVTTIMGLFFIASISVKKVKMT